MRRMRFALLLAVVPALLSEARPEGDGAEGLYLPLFVEERGGVDREGEPVRSGLPLPESAAVVDAARLYLLGRGESGAFDREVPLVARIASRWGGRPSDAHRAAKWALLEFPASVAAGGTAEYRLRYDLENSFRSLAERQGPETRLVGDDGRRLSVDTGRLGFSVRRDRFGLFEELSLDGRMRGPGPEGGPILDVTLVDSSGTVYRASGAAPREVLVEESSALSAVLLVRGGFADSAGRSLLEGWVGYSIRVHLFAGSAEVRLFITLENNGFYGREADWSAAGGTERWLRFERLEVSLRTVLGSSPRADIERGTEGVALGDRGFRLLQDHRIERVPEDLDDESRNFVYTLDRGDGPVATRGRSRGAFRVGGTDGSITVAVRHFFENWPGALGFRDGVIRIEPWPEEGRWPPGSGEGVYVFEGGRWKTREIALDFGGGDPGILARRIARPLFARASSEWCAASGALGPMAPLSFPMGNRASAEALARLNRLQAVVVDVSAADAQPLGVREPAVPPISLVTQREMRGNAFKIAPYDTDLYGAMNFGDLPHALGFSSLHYDMPGGILLQYLRHDGRREFLDIGEEMTRHRYDIDQYHCRETSASNWQYYNGFQRVDQGWHGDYARSAAYRSEGTPHPNYTWLAGLLLHHALTGDPRSLETARENADAVARYARLALGAEGSTREIGQHHEVRTAALSILNLVEFAGFTGEEGYLATAHSLWKNALAYSEELRGNRGLFEPEERQHLWNLVLSLEPLRKLHAATGDPEVLSMLARICRRLEGVYLAGSGRMEDDLYRPLQLPTWWREGSVAGTEIPYGLLASDAFAWVYLTTGERRFLDFARRLFHDSVIYREAPGGARVPPEFEAAVSYNPWKFPCTEVRIHAWTLRAHQVYLHAEWLESRSAPVRFRFPGDGFRRPRSGGTPAALPEESARGAAGESPGGPGREVVLAVPVRTGLLRATWRATVPRAGVYSVSARWPAEATSAVEYRLTHRGGEHVVPILRRGRSGQWVALGRLYLDPESELGVELTGLDGINRAPGEVRLTRE